MTMTPEERLEEIYNVISDEIASGRDMLLSTQRLLNVVMSLATGQDMNQAPAEEPTVPTIIISCDASIKVNPGGQAAIGAVIRIPEEEKALIIQKLTPSTTNNEAEYDAIYEGLIAIGNLHNRPKYPIIIRSDSQLVVKQLTNEYVINNDVLKRKHQSIHELAAALPVSVAIEWRPRNSTPDLTAANFAAQDALGVKRH